MHYVNEHVYYLLTVDDSNRTEWERQREREEFARTARVFQPLGSSLSSKFTRSQEEIPTGRANEEEVYVNAHVDNVSTAWTLIPISML